MSRHAPRLGIAAVALAAWVGVAAPDPSADSTATTLGRRLSTSGRATVGFDRSSEDPASGGSRSEPGRLTLERSDRIAIEFSRTGERLTLRPDGGEWVQPRLHQMIVLGPQHAASAARFWQLLVQGSAPGLTVEHTGRGRLVILIDDPTEPDSAWLELDSAGLPRSLRLHEGVGVASYRFKSWSFGREKGRSAFVQSAPPGYEVVRPR